MRTVSAVAALLLVAGCGEAAQDRSSVPDEVQAACGKPGSRVEVKQVPVTVKHSECDLTGVYLLHEGVGSVVPSPGSNVAGSFDGTNARQSRSVVVSRNKVTNDVTFSAS